MGYILKENIDQIDKVYTRMEILKNYLNAEQPLGHVTPLIDYCKLIDTFSIQKKNPMLEDYVRNALNAEKVNPNIGKGDYVVGNNYYEFKAYHMHWIELI